MHFGILATNNDSILAKRPDREFLHEFYEPHHRDAVAMERLTLSPYVMDVYGYCGQSVLTELAFAEKGLQHLYRLASRLRDVYTAFALRSKLQIAAMTSLGLAHIHGVAIDDGDGGDTRHAPEETIAYNSSAGEIPEQGPGKRISEKADVYSLGNTFYVLLTGLEPRGKEDKRRRHASVSDLVAGGVRPTFPEGYTNATDPAIVAIREAIRLCWEPDPRDRPAAMEVAKFLYAALEKLDKPPYTS